MSDWDFEMVRGIELEVRAAGGVIAVPRELGLRSRDLEELARESEEMSRRDALQLRFVHPEPLESPRSIRGSPTRDR